MADDLFDRFIVDSAGRNPLSAARRDLRKPLRKRVYEQAQLRECEGGYALVLDGKRAVTPARRFLVLPTRASAEAVVAEWARQGRDIDPVTMPMTRIVNTAIDGVADQMSAVRGDIVKFAGSDLICYRATGPTELVALEAAAWDPILAWARDELAAPLVVTTGIGFAEQPPAALAAIASTVADVQQPVALAALHTMTTLLGSAVLALAVTRRFLSAYEGWTAAHVDEDYQVRTWGEDDEALARKAGRWREMEAAAALHAAVVG